MSDFGNYGLGELQDVVDPGPIGDPDSAAEEEEEQILAPPRKLGVAGGKRRGGV